MVAHETCIKEHGINLDEEYCDSEIDGYLDEIIENLHKD